MRVDDGNAVFKQSQLLYVVESKVTNRDLICLASKRLNIVWC